MSRSVVVVIAAALVVSAGCTDRLPTKPRAAVAAAHTRGAAITIPANASSMCVASAAALAELDAKLGNAPADLTLIKAVAAQANIATDICY